MGIFVETIENHRNEGYAKHPNFPAFLAIAGICDPMHDKKGYQKPGDAIQLAGKTGIQLPKKGTDDRL